MTEYISREEARKEAITNTNHFSDRINLVDFVMNLPASDVREVKKSKWFDGRCTDCGFKPALDYEYDTVYDDYNDYRWNFCPNCGADMRGEIQPSFGFSADDVREVVLCKDCKFYTTFNNGCNGSCDKRIDAFATFYPNDFCSYGERKEQI